VEVLPLVLDQLCDAHLDDMLCDDYGSARLAVRKHTLLDSVFLLAQEVKA
jgi:hypothetical protein